MKSGDHTYIWQAGDWPSWRYDLAALARSLATVSRAQGLLIRPIGRTVYLLPPYLLNEEHVAYLAERTVATLHAVL